MKSIKIKFVIAHMKVAEIYGNLSYDTKHKVGATLVKNNKPIAIGYNGTPAGEDNNTRDENGFTKANVIHAEHNALKALHRSAETSVDALLFVTLSPCERCAIDLVDGGVKAVFFKRIYENIDGLIYLQKHGVKLFQVHDSEAVDFVKIWGADYDKLQKVQVFDQEITFDNFGSLSFCIRQGK